MFDEYDVYNDMYDDLRAEHCCEHCDEPMDKEVFDWGVDYVCNNPECVEDLDEEYLDDEELDWDTQAA